MCILLENHSKDNKFSYNVKKYDFSKEEKEILGEIRSKLIDLAISNGSNMNINEEQFGLEIKNILTSYGIKNTSKLLPKIVQEILGFGKLDSMIKDDDLEEIMVLGVNKPVYVFHRKEGMLKSNITFNQEFEIKTLIESIARTVNRRIDQQSPILDARLLDGSRVNATLPPISADGPTITIRKFRNDPLTVVDLINFKTMNLYLAAFLWLCIDGMGVNPANIIISGGTGSGKTTTLNSISHFVSPNERIVSIEDTLELQIPHEHIIRMETRPPNIENQGEITMDLLVKNALRQRPDRIIVGEVRSNEAITLFTALNTGHSGFGTLHANNSRETITRLINPPMDVPEIMISAIDFIIVQNRIHSKENGSGSIRRIVEVSEVVGIEEGTIQLNTLFKWNPLLDDVEYVGINSKTINTISELKGIDLKSIEMEINQRKTVLDYLCQNNIRDKDSISNVVKEYYYDSQRVLENIFR